MVQFILSARYEICDQNEIDHIFDSDMHICMDWRSVKFDWNRARAFLVTAEEGSLSAAARALGVAQPTLGRQVDALETELGVVLFERLGRGLSLTPAGHGLLEHVRAMGQAANDLSLAALGQTQDVKGVVSIAASEVYAAFLLPKILARLRAEHPGVGLRIVASSATSDLRRHEADIAIRNFRPKEPDLIARKIRDVPARLYASPAYLERIGRPQTPEDLHRAEFIDIDDRHSLMHGLNARGLNLTPENFPIMTESYLVMWDYVRAGLGIGILDGNIGDADPLVERALPDFDPLVFPIWLVAHRDLVTSRRIRVVFDALATALAGPSVQ